MTGSKPSLRRRDREHARAAADVEQAAALEVAQSSSRQSCVVGCAPVPKARPGSITTGDRARASAPPTAARPRAGRPRPGGGNRVHSLLPAVRHGLDANVAEPRTQPVRSRLVGERGELDVAAVARPPRTPPERARASRPSPPRRARRERRPNARSEAQRKALFSFSKNPSSRLVRLLGRASARTRRAAAAARRSAAAARRR